MEEKKEKKAQKKFCGRELREAWWNFLSSRERRKKKQEKKKKKGRNEKGVRRNGSTRHISVGIRDFVLYVRGESNGGNSAAKNGDGEGARREWEV